MKTYRKPITKAIDLEGELILAGSEGDGMNNTNNKMGWSGNTFGFAKGANGPIIDDDEEE